VSDGERRGQKKRGGENRKWERRRGQRRREDGSKRVKTIKEEEGSEENSRGGEDWVNL
jgi:hypothetical protein